MCLCVSVSVACVRACVRARVHAYMRVCVRVRMHLQNVVVCVLKKNREGIEPSNDDILLSHRCDLVSEGLGFAHPNGMCVYVCVCVCVCVCLCVCVYGLSAKSLVSRILRVFVSVCIRV